jgi:hypothetical protein
MAQELEHQNKHEVRIHIDQHRYESPNPTTAAALYLLGHVAPAWNFTAKSTATERTSRSRTAQKSSA